ncbi:MAG: type II toxin-antitoxin system MqsA family antitoxin [Nitrospirae bacterium]|nr:type II toxin-antitoxin system MqsA family antitoxin [Nitrospirota bacterium]
MQENCPICGGNLSGKVTDETFTYKGKTKTIPDYVTYACIQCGESIVDPKTLKESGKILKDFQREVDGLLTGIEIKKIRAGRICQSTAMYNLLRILDRYPNVIHVLLKDTTQEYRVTNIIRLSEIRQKYKTKAERFNTQIKELQYGT